MMTSGVIARAPKKAESSGEKSAAPAAWPPNATVSTSRIHGTERRGAQLCR